MPVSITFTHYQQALGLEGILKSIWISGYTVTTTFVLGIILRQLFLNRNLVKFQAVFDESINEKIKGGSFNGMAKPRE